MSSKPTVLVIGGGIAGLSAAINLANMGASPVIIEKEDKLGGKLNLWDRLFPKEVDSREMVKEYVGKISDLNIPTRLSSTVSRFVEQGKGVELDNGEIIKGDAVILATGFDIFDARIKEEYGYGIYDNVFTSVELEQMLHDGKVSMRDGSKPEKIAILHCVGSRDEKVDQKHCSRLCCMTGVKQAVEIKEILGRDTQVFNFYMDIRMFSKGYEELYRHSQEKWGVNFVRGRISEASETIDKKIQIKAEDTLIGRPLKVTVDMLVLMVGMKSPECNEVFAESAGLTLDQSGFFETKDAFSFNVDTENENIFIAGTASSPKNIGESINDGAMAALRVFNHISNK